MNQELRTRLLGSAAIEDIVAQATRLIELTSYMDANDVDRLLQASGLLHEVSVKAETLAMLPTSAETVKPEDPVPPVLQVILESVLRQHIGRDPNPGDLRCAAANGYPKYSVGQPVRVTLNAESPSQVRTIQSVDHVLDGDGDLFWGYGFGGGLVHIQEDRITAVPKS